MPAPLPASATLGALLRLVEQEKSKGTAEQTPGLEPANPLRKAVQAPLESPVAPESPESARVMSLKSEAGITPGTGAEAAMVTPTSAKVGPIGGGEQDVGTGPVTQVSPEQLNQFINTNAGQSPQPTLEDYLKQGKTAAQWYAETGKQSELDKIGKAASFGGVGNFNQFLETGQPANPELAVNPQTGQTYQAPRPQGEPNNATLQEYLAQGKTAAQWYAETGRQSELDKLTKGATQPVPQPVQLAWQAGIVPQVGEGGQYTIPAAPAPTATPGQPQTQSNEFIGPLAQGQLRPQLTPTAAATAPSEFIGPIRPELSAEGMTAATANYAIPTNAPTPTPPNELTRKINEAKSPEETQVIIDQWIKENHLEGYLIPTPTPTPTPARR